MEDWLSEERFRSYLLGLGRAQPTIANYVRARRRWLSWCADTRTRPLKAKASDVVRWMECERQRDRSSTVRLYALGLSVLYGWLAEEGAVKENPLRSIRLGNQVSRPSQPFSDAEIRALYSACETAEDRACFLLLLGGGLRASELCGIRPNDVDWTSGEITILGKGAKYRRIAPGAAAMEALQELLESSHGMPASRSGLDGWLRRLASKAGLSCRVHLHMFRYTFAVRFCEAGGGIDLLQTILGHADVTMSMYYSRKGREQRALAAQRRLSPADQLMRLSGDDKLAG